MKISSAVISNNKDKVKEVQRKLNQSAGSESIKLLQWSIQGNFLCHLLEQWQIIQ
jgi:hypothetical protein